MIVKEGAWYGWPKCYFDPHAEEARARLPNTAATAARRSAICDKAEPPVAAIPAHWAPNDLKIYKAAQFPKAYVGGAFIAFHGSWNRAPGPAGRL